MFDYLLIFVTFLSLPLIKSCMNFVKVYMDENDRLFVLRVLFFSSVLFSILIKLFLMKSSPSFFHEFIGVGVSFSLVIFVFSCLLFSLRVFVWITEKALAP